MLDTEIKVTPQLAAEHGLTADEYGRIQKILGRDPNITELGIFSVMWSEHCSYKSSKVHLRRLPTRGPQVLQGPGENAGVVDIGDGLAAAFKMESHNHPSYVEPFQGAATGVGGILRDIFTMGARPIAVLDSLRFGPISANVSGAGETGFSPSGQVTTKGALAPQPADRIDAETIAHNRRILDGVVRGISHYGNCFGVPTVGGEVQFEAGYSANPLVNVLALGIAKKEDLFFAKARGVGNPVIYVGAKTGRDGIHGASLLASAEFTEESQQKRPNVQVGDPFMEKLLLEACLEAMKTGAIVAIQDMGAAGLTSTSCEMASRGGLGIEMELTRVPQREPGMTPYEMMLSESQERMLLVAARGREQEVLNVFAKWGLDAVEIGRVTEDGFVRVLHHAKVVAEIPAHALAEEGPVYQRPLAAPAPVTNEHLVAFAEPGKNLTENFRALLASPAIASKRYIWEQYDYMVRTNTIEAPGAGDAAVVRIKGTKRALALASDGNGRWCRLDPFVGAQLAVAEAARNVACSGAKPMAATNCLNFGSPEKPEVMWQFSRAIDGISEACIALEIPITGGNVSFYNETLGRSIDPTPVLGVLGMIENAPRALGMAFRATGDAILLLDGIASASSSDENAAKEFSSSEYARTTQGVEAGAPPAINLPAEKRLIALLVALAQEGQLQSAHDVSDGGLAVTLAESCFTSNGLSAQISLTSKEPDELAFFGERGARAVVSVTPENVAAVRRIAAQYEVAAVEVGRVASDEFRIELNGQMIVSAEVPSLADAWSGALGRLLNANDLRKAE
ncbi:MAG TPA: phosphoribosylformylglycinamidine synthase subunit PurL [Candidatus Acidoferrales bacterium]|jgi:phosphoribosylformylglycinamidine synthase|nr:phosphoribosylformylglycinamidine synthase subunit PurL [Candidatus Acidoferrales bacterium]